MDREKVRMIVRNIDLLVHSLKQELESLPDEVTAKEDVTIGPYIGDYDEVFGG
jgi:hypothetical protein